MAEEGRPIEAAIGAGEAEAAEADAAAGLDPIAAALAMDAAKRRGPMDPGLAAYLARQERLVELQTEHLHEQRDLQLAHLLVRRWKDRLSLTVQAMGVALALTVFCGLCAVVWQAHQDRGLAIQRFTAPPSFAARGVTGDVVAEDVLGKLSSIVAFVRERSFSSTGGVSTDTSSDVKIEIPETGVSLTEAWRMLREELGSAHKVSGDLREETDGRVTLTARLDSGRVFSATGPASDLGALEQNVAEQLYGAVDPNNLAVYFGESGRKADAFAAAARYASAPLSREDRANAVTMLGDVSEDPWREVRFARLALRTDPGLMAAHLNIADGDLALGHCEEALSEARKMLAVRPEDQPPQHRGAGAGHMLAFAQSTIDGLTGDYAAAVADRGLYRGNNRRMLLLENAANFALRHDWVASFNLIDEASAFGTAGPRTERLARYDAFTARDDWAGARAEAQALVTFDEANLAASTDPDAAAGIRADLERQDRPLLAIAQARAGDVAGARAVANATPLDCYGCLRARGVVEALAGNPAQAERWFAEAIRQGPDLPQAYAERGDARLGRGDVSGALSDAETAGRLGPHFADALKLWGDALARQGRWPEAKVRYDAALADAPAWASLKQARTAARVHSG